MGQMQNPPAPSLEAFNALNSHIATQESSSWCTPNTTNFTLDSASKCSKSANTISFFIKGVCKISGNPVVLTMESGFRPLIPLYFMCKNNTDNTIAGCGFATDGTVTIYNSVANKTYEICFTYVIAT